MKSPFHRTIIAAFAAIAIYAMPCVTENQSVALAIETERSKSLNKRQSRVAWKLLKNMGVGAEHAMHTLAYNVDISCSSGFRGSVVCEAESSSESGTWSKKNSKKWLRIFRKLRIQQDCGMGQCHYQAAILCTKAKRGRSRTPGCQITGTFSR